MLWRFDLTSYIHQDVTLVYQFDPNYTDYCSASNPNCVSGSTCPDCTDPANPIIDVAADMISYFDVIPHTSVEELEIQMEIFPNPSNGFFNIETSDNLKSNAIVSVFNATGNIIYQFSWDGKSRLLDFTFLSKGVYVMKVQSEKGVAIKKIIIQ